MRFQLLRHWFAFARRCLLQAKYLLFLGVAAFRLMPDDAHDNVLSTLAPVGLKPLLVEGILHRLAIHGQRLVLGVPGLIPRIERLIQRPRFNPYQAVSNDIFAGDDNVLSTLAPIASVLTSAVKSFAGLLPQGIGPFGHGFVPAHAAQSSARRDAQHRRQAMAQPLFAARIGNDLETLR